VTDDELNAAVAVEVMGWTWHEPGEAYNILLGGWYEGLAHRRRQGWSPATDYNDVFEVVERMRDKRHWLEILSPTERDVHWCVFVRPFGTYHRDDISAISGGDSLPRAICEAVIEAKRSET